VHNHQSISVQQNKKKLQTKQKKLNKIKNKQTKTFAVSPSSDDTLGASSNAETRQTDRLNRVVEDQLGG